MSLLFSLKLDAQLETRKALHVLNKLENRGFIEKIPGFSKLKFFLQK